MNDMKMITLLVPSDADLSYKTAEVDGLTLGVLTRVSADAPMYISGVLNHYMGRCEDDDQGTL